MAINMNFDLNSFLSAIIGGSLTIIAALIALAYQDKKEKERKLEEEQKLREKFFMELNYNKRKIIYTIENESYKLTGLDNLHWKNFIYSRASYILMKDKELIDELATLDSMIDQINDRIQTINKSETAMIFNADERIKDINKKMHSAFREYAKKELKPQIDKAIERLEKLYKNS